MDWYLWNVALADIMSCLLQNMCLHFFLSAIWLVLLFQELFSHLDGLFLHPTIAEKYTGVISREVGRGGAPWSEKWGKSASSCEDCSALVSLGYSMGCSNATVVKSYFCSDVNLCLFVPLPKNHLFFPLPKKKKTISDSRSNLIWNSVKTAEIGE